MNFIRHLIECHCTLKIFENKTKPIYHKFPVFSITDENGNIDELKYVSCNNCGAIHEVKDFCKSEIIWGADDMISLVISKEDIKHNLIEENQNKLVDVLEENFPEDISTWELAYYCIDNNIEYSIPIKKNDIKDNTVITFLNIKEKSFKIKKEVIQRYI